MKAVTDELLGVWVIQVMFDNLLLLSLVYMVLKAVWYRRRYLKVDKHDNMYITQLLYEVSRMKMLPCEFAPLCL